MNNTQYLRFRKIFNFMWMRSKWRRRRRNNSNKQQNSFGHGRRNRKWHYKM